MSTKKKLSIAYDTAIILIVVYIILRLLFVTFAEVSGRSMVPTLKDGEVLLCRRVYGMEDIEVGDIVIACANNTRVVKRVAGKAGDTDILSVDKTFVVCDKVPEGCVFLLGDNYAVSMDSRDFGPVAMKDIRYVWTGFRIASWAWYGTVFTVIFVFTLVICLLECKLSKEEKAAKAMAADIEKGGEGYDGNEETDTNGDSGTAGAQCGQDGNQ